MAELKEKPPLRKLIQAQWLQSKAKKASAPMHNGNNGASAAAANDIELVKMNSSDGAGDSLEPKNDDKVSALDPN